MPPLLLPINPGPGCVRCPAGRSAAGDGGVAALLLAACVLVGGLLLLAPRLRRPASTRW